MSFFPDPVACGKGLGCTSDCSTLVVNNNCLIVNERVGILVGGGQSAKGCQVVGLVKVVAVGCNGCCTVIAHAVFAALAEVHLGIKFSKVILGRERPLFGAAP